MTFRRLAPLALAAALLLGCDTPAEPPSPPQGTYSLEAESYHMLTGVPKSVFDLSSRSGINIDFSGGLFTGSAALLVIYGGVEYCVICQFAGVDAVPITLGGTFEVLGDRLILRGDSLRSDYGGPTHGAWFYGIPWKIERDAFSVDTTFPDGSRLRMRLRK